MEMILLPPDTMPRRSAGFSQVLWYGQRTEDDFDGLYRQVDGDGDVVGGQVAAFTFTAH